MVQLLLWKHPLGAEGFLEAQRSGARATPPRELATMAYEHDEVLRDPVVADYCRSFGIAAERSRLTGAQPPLSG